MPDIVALCKDLMFTVKIQQAAKAVGMNARFVASSQAILEAATQSPTAIVLDLALPDVDVLGLIGDLKADPLSKNIPLIGYVPHVQVDLRQSALQRGCDAVVARSVFSEQLPSLLQRYLQSQD